MVLWIFIRYTLLSFTDPYNTLHFVQGSDPFNIKKLGIHPEQVCVGSLLWSLIIDYNLLVYCKCLLQYKVCIKCLYWGFLYKFLCRRHRWSKKKILWNSLSLTWGWPEVLCSVHGSHCSNIVQVGLTRRVDRELCFFSNRPNWDSTTPSPAGECAPAPWRWGWGGGPNSDEGTDTVDKLNI
jgi:hypothetical protein